jgi:predicted transcriptional regulator
MNSNESVPSVKHEQARRMLDRIGILRNPCDLDLLLFFVRHSRALLTSDQIAAYIGYDVKRIGDSLDRLIDAKLLTRSQNPAHAARMYVFSVAGPNGGWLPALVDLVSTREGRLAMRDALATPSPRSAGEPDDRRAHDRLNRAG